MTVLGWFRELPWRVVHDLVVRSRRLYFTIPRPDAQGVFVEASLAEIEDELGSARWYFEDGTVPSYHYMGEDLNLRRPDGRTNGRWMQLHARFFETGGPRVFTLIHREPSPLIHPKAHIEEVDFSWVEGREAFREIATRARWNWEVGFYEGKS